MNYQEFSLNTVKILHEDTFNLLKEALVGEYLSFYSIDEEDITPVILSEKVCDYFEKLEIKTGKNFDKQLDIFMNDLDSIINNRIVKTPKAKKKDTIPVAACRARKYYNKAADIRTIRTKNIGKLIDYSRIMLCLYQAIIENQFKEITNFDYSLEKLDPTTIVQSMKNEADAITIKLGKKKRFNINELYCSDTGTFIITIILLFRIIDNRVQGEYSNE